MKLSPFVLTLLVGIAGTTVAQRNRGGDDAAMGGRPTGMGNLDNHDTGDRGGNEPGSGDDDAGSEMGRPRPTDAAGQPCDRGDQDCIRANFGDRGGSGDDDNSDHTRATGDRPRPDRSTRGPRTDTNGDAMSTPAPRTDANGAVLVPTDANGTPCERGDLACLRAFFEANRPDRNQTGDRTWPERSTPAPRIDDNGDVVVPTDADGTPCERGDLPCLRAFFEASGARTRPGRSTRALRTNANGGVVVLPTSAANGEAVVPTNAAGEPCEREDRDCFEANGSNRPDGVTDGANSAADSNSNTGVDGAAGSDTHATAAAAAVVLIVASAIAAVFVWKRRKVSTDDTDNEALYSADRVNGLENPVYDIAGQGFAGKSCRDSAISIA